MIEIESQYCDYQPISSDELEKGIKKIIECWNDFINNAKVSYCDDGNKDVKWKADVDDYALREMVERVHQRNDYFYRYHAHMAMSEYKEIGLYMFWLTKFRPFRLLEHNYESGDAFSINEDFAMYYMLSALKILSERLQKKYSKQIKLGMYTLNYNARLLSGDLYDEIRYTLSYRDVSKEVLGVLVELVANILIPDIKLLNEE